MRQYRHGTTGLTGPQPKPCKTCGRTFQPRYNRNVYCSDRCRLGAAECETCGGTFLVKDGASGRFCSRDCWYRVDRASKPCPVCSRSYKGGSKTCSVDCGKELQRRSNPVRISHCTRADCGNEIVGKKPRVRYCSRRCSMLDRNHKRGGPTLPDGTRRPASKGYVRVKVSGQWILEHRHEMELALGRPLLPSETPHHVNGDRADNATDGVREGFRYGNLELWSSSQPPGQRVNDKVEWAVELLRQYRPDLLAELPHCPGCRCGELET
jgi:hypothetical protein